MCNSLHKWYCVFDILFCIFLSCSVFFFAILYERSPLGNSSTLHWLATNSGGETGPALTESIMVESKSLPDEFCVKLTIIDRHVI